MQLLFVFPRESPDWIVGRFVRRFAVENVRNCGIRPAVASPFIGVAEIGGIYGVEARRGVCGTLC